MSVDVVYSWEGVDLYVKSLPTFPLYISPAIKFLPVRFSEVELHR